MRSTVRSSKLDRRQFALGARRGARAPALPAAAHWRRTRRQGWEQAVKKILGDAKPIDGKIMIDLPEIAENGNTVPFTSRSTAR